ncbi:linear amide C-N hydrolase [Eudoraea sp.]|uniref:linear amide C-N hydrolase n=1 Tax=Eudoraea sp. TaxID=1979955 RepID=UPI003C75080C
MAILKNEPIYPFEKGKYCKPHHIIVKGSWKEIGFDLGTIGKNEYGVKLLPYFSPVYGQARQEYWTQNWPHVAELQKGVLKAFAHPEDSVEFDGTNLNFDWYDCMRSGLDLGGNTCSGLVLPPEKSDGGAVLVGRNLDFHPAVEWTTTLGKEVPEGAFGACERPVVVEFQPDEGYRSIIVSTNELLMGYVDGINEKGLWISCMHDPSGVGADGSPPGGGDVSGLVVTQLLQVLLTTCITVEEAKKAILKNRIMQTLMNLHIPIVDATGAATVFEIDQKTGAYVFADRVAGEPLFSTNHPIHTWPTPDTFPEVDMTEEHNTFVRQIMLREAYSELKPPFTLDDAGNLIDTVHCSFVDSVEACAQAGERTLINIKADLSKPEIHVRWYLRDVAPIAGTNHMQDEMSDFYTFGF